MASIGCAPPSCERILAVPGMLFAAMARQK
jgi:hypothetical protein